MRDSREQLEAALRDIEDAAGRARAVLKVELESESKLKPRGNEGRMLTPQECADIAGVTRRQVLSWSRRSDWRGFTHRLSRKVLRIEEAGYRRWLGLRRE